ncbi:MULTISPECIES: HprK-related kinase A [Sphingomonas]|uniref:HprK-related kinase A n=1 Tax=Sphingomonas TaxID=13687 RepID=UPI0006FD10BD|nr:MULTISPECIES: HprK-related kinase A [Sphingomonas]KQM94655.1 serine kinase [Sphingomonas sp. Leaf226]MDY0968008.1 HprK-related kinase A [Sphingomonas sp. CFBP9021]USR01183.1 HprK-related kinase A [Sphingomonas aerolata]
MRHAFALRIGPIGFRIGSDWRAPIDQLRSLYRDYPAPQDGVADYTVRLFARRPWRRWLRPSVEIGGDYMLPEAAPLPLRHGLLAAEMAMNLQMALGARRHLLLHASAVERDGRAVLMTGVSGAGKSTLATLLAARGWRFMGDEFVLLDPATGLLHAFPRLISLKNAAIPAAEAAWPDARMGPLMAATPKGDIRHMVPDARAIAAMDRPATPALLLFPRYGDAAAVRPVPPAEAFVRMTQASTNYVALGEPGFTAMTRLIAQVPAVAIDYPDGASGVAQVEALCAAL